MSRERIVQTERLAATTWLPSDVEDLLVVHSDPQTMKFVRQGRPETREETAALIRQYTTEHAASGFTKWRLTDLDGRFVGRAGFGPQLDGRELAFTIRRDLWGQGLATEVGAALVSWHMAHAPAVLLYAYVSMENPASRRVLAKIGFKSLRQENYCGVQCELLNYGPTP